MKRITLTILTCLLAINAFGEETEEKKSSYDPDKPALFTFGAGRFDVTRKHPMNSYQFEYRSWRQWLPNLRPMAGIMWSQKGSVYVYGGIGLDIYLIKQKIVLTPSFAPGIYFKGGGKNLHYPLEFRSSIDLAYVFDNKGRFGAQFFHLSHAGLGGKNPGTEVLLFYFAVPLRIP